MSNNDGITDDVRKREEDYFRRKDRELIERMRSAARAVETRKELETATGIHDDESLRELEALGFTPQTVVLLPLVPVLQVAWAEAGVSSAERGMIVALARARGIDPGSEADHLLQEWLEHRPADDVFRKAMRLIAAILDHPDTGLQITADDLIAYCDRISHASGGLFGIGAVSAAEKAAMQEIAAQLKNR